MRTSITLDDDVYELASTYAAARQITLGAAIGELVRRRSEQATSDESQSMIRMSPHGIPIMSSRGGPMSMDLVKALQDDEIG